jgi:adenylate cyclase
MYEIERRFLIKDFNAMWQDIVDHGTITEEINQGYLSTDKDKTIRVRLTKNRTSGANPAYLTVKGKTVGIKKIEIEEEISVSNAAALYTNFCETKISKVRHSVKLNGMIWELDEFDLYKWIAEIELTSEDQEIILPTWLGEEITHDHRYSNANMSKTGWPDEEA